ncbi:type II toxin-antitoxin system RelB/DinJ family antitoxin [Levilactobacillus andaensis]|uniref:type II toxin-antitoxin system RelB/DinJ family antitoxin n=1 Tax=Levilactobacillus andaensis TaxID=2799570 RepID=UPI001944373C|nr:type II toxin-antitoxin system RelB/DinJ family antitoxin [Levilactobacillus andaensis]
MSPDVKNKIVSTRISSDTYEQAKNNLAAQGFTISEYIRLSLVQAANNHGNLLDFSDAVTAKNETETGQVITIGSLTDFDDWIDSLKNPS